jgi:preprotein translocase SecF subunit
VRDIIGKRNWFFLFSGLIVVPGLIFILLTPLTNGAAGLKFSIDYTGGTLWEISFRNGQPSIADVQAVLTAQKLPDSQVSTESDGYILIRTKPIGLRPAPVLTPSPSVAPSASAGASAPASPGASAGASASPGSSASAAASASPTTTASSAASAAPSGSPGPSSSPAPSGSAAASGSPAASASPGASAAAVASVSPSPVPTPTPAFVVPTEGQLGSLATALQAKFGPISGIRQQTTIGPIISSELTTQAIILVILGSLGILLWVSFRFQDVKFGTSAIIALVHDVIVVVGIFAILGTFFGVQIDALFVTAMLTIIGFSVHDTIVVFDRIRENRQRHAGEPFAAIVNHSILQTLGRSINTSMTVVITLLALLLFGASNIQDFVVALLIGIVSGTYSSIFNASPILVVWNEWEERRKQQALALARGLR